MRNTGYIFRITAAERSQLENLEPELDDHFHSKVLASASCLQSSGSPADPDPGTIAVYAADCRVVDVGSAVFSLLTSLHSPTPSPTPPLLSTGQEPVWCSPQSPFHYNRRWNKAKNEANTRMHDYTRPLSDLP